MHGNTPEEVRQDKEGLQIMRTLGDNMAWLLKCIEPPRGPCPIRCGEPWTPTNSSVRLNRKHDDGFAQADLIRARIPRSAGSAVMKTKQRYAFVAPGWNRILCGMMIFRE